MAARDGSLHRFGWYGLGAVRVTRGSSPFATTRGIATAPELVAARRVRAADPRRRQLSADGTTGKIALNIIRQTFPNITTMRDATFL